MDLAKWRIHPAYVVSALMVVYIVLDLKITIPLIMDFYDLFDAWDIIKMFASTAVMGLSVLYLVLTKHDNLVKVLSITAFAVGFGCMYDSYVILYEYKEYMDGDLSAFIQGVISFAIALMLTLNSITYFRGLSKNTNMIFYAVIGLLALFILSVVIELHEGVPFLEIIETYEDSLPYYALLILMLLMLRSDSVKVNTTMYIITSSIRDMRRSFAGDGLSIPRSVAERIMRITEDGLGCSSYSFMLETFYREKYEMKMERIGDNLIVSISSIQNRSGMDIFRFVFKGSWTDTGDVSTCDLFRIYGDDGFYIQLIARDSLRLKTKKVPKRGALYLFGEEPGTWFNKYKVKRNNIIETVKGWIFGPGYKRKYLE